MCALTLSFLPVRGDSIGGQSDTIMQRLGVKPKVLTCFSMPPPCLDKQVNLPQAITPLTFKLWPATKELISEKTNKTTRLGNRTQDHSEVAFVNQGFTIVRKSRGAYLDSPFSTSVIASNLPAQVS